VNLQHKTLLPDLSRHTISTSLKHLPLVARPLPHLRRHLIATKRASMATRTRSPTGFPDTTSINLNRLLSRLERIVLAEPTPQLRKSSYERARVSAVSASDSSLAVLRYSHEAHCWQNGASFNWGYRTSSMHAHSSSTSNTLPRPYPPSPRRQRFRQSSSRNESLSSSLISGYTS
jgi:hypothetical protein